MSKEPLYNTPSRSNEPIRHHILSVLVQNRAGVLARVASLFARRGFNIFSLAVAPAEEEGMSRITIVVDVQSTPLEQVTKQLFKLIDVIKISELDPRHSVERELLLATVRAEPDLRGQVVELVRGYGIVELQRTGRVALPKLDREARLRAVRGRAS